MTNPYFSPTEVWRIPQAAITDSLAEMAIDGERGNEGIVLWLGRDDGEVCEVTQLVRLRGPLVEKFPDLINVNPVLFNEVADLAIEHKARLIGQVHSHGPGYRLDLSPTDREYGIQAPHYLSLVTPDYGNTTLAVEHWGVHVFQEGEGYLRLTLKEVRKRIQILPGAPLPFLTVGGRE